MTALQHLPTTGLPTVYLLHGVLAVPDAEDGYTTVEVQQGMVIALDARSMTVISPDGFTRDYALHPADDHPSLRPGTPVTVLVLGDGSVHVAGVGEPPRDGTALAALAPVDHPR